MEVLIAITILSFITIAIVTIQSDSRQAKDRVVSEDRDLLQVETAFSRFEWDFSQIYSPFYFSHEMKKDIYAPEYEKSYTERLISSYLQNSRFGMVSFDGHPIPTFQFPDKSSLIFFTTSNRRKQKDIKQSNFAWVKFALEKDEEAEENQGKNKWVRYFVAENPFDKEIIDWENVKGQVLLRNVSSIKFEFWSPTRKKWSDNVDLIKNGKYIIHGIKVTMEWFNKDGIEELFVRVFRPNFPSFNPEDMYEFLKPKEYQTNQNPASEDPYINVADPDNPGSGDPDPEPDLED